MTTAHEDRLAVYRRRVLDAAERELARSGYAGTRMGEVAAGADLSLATVYKAYPGKAEIWDALHEERMAALLTQVEAATATTSTSTTTSTHVGRLLDGVAAVAAFLMDRPDYLRLNLRAGTGWTESAGARGVQATVWTAGIDMLERGVAAAVAVGEVPEVRPRVAAGMLVSGLQVWLSDWVESGFDRDVDVVVAEMREHLARLLGAV